jgi:thiamine biosynthesis protein ThiS
MTTDGEQVRIRLNGEERSVPAGLDVAELLERVGVDRREVVVERNRQILRRDELEDVSVEEGDTLELVHFVGGG